MQRDLVNLQLNKVNFADLDNFDTATGCFIIPRYTRPVYAIGKCYLIKLTKDLINNTASIIATNWNNGTAPSSEYLKIYVNKQNGKMIFVDSIGFDIETKQSLATMWSGWLPTNSITQLTTLE